MARKNALAVAAIVVVGVIGATLLVAAFLGGGQSQAVQESEVNSFVTTFGRQLQNVSLLAPNASSTIAKVYGPYVTPQLLKTWEANPSIAPGRTTSSPWPARIEIDSISPQGSGYIVNGKIILMTSSDSRGTDAGSIPVIIQVVRSGREWQIAAYQQQRGLLR